MDEKEREQVRAVNPAMRRDPPHREPAEGADADAAEVKATQGAELSPRDQGGIDEARR